MKHENVQEYYGKTLQSSADLQTNACCEPAEMPSWLKKILAQLHDAVLMRYYGCGLIAPEALKGARVLDLGCGAGRDVYALSQMVGEEGFVVGVDMTDAQLDVARSFQDYHREAFGYRASNVAFHKGYIESLGDLPLDPDSFDVIVSNCVVNLATDKQAVLRGAYELLKPGGEMYFRMSMPIAACQRLWRAMRCSTANACLELCIGMIFLTIRKWQASQIRVWSPIAPSPLKTRCWKPR